MRAVLHWLLLRRARRRLQAAEKRLDAVRKELLRDLGEAKL